MFIRWIKFNSCEFLFARDSYDIVFTEKMENTLETMTAKAIAGRFRNNGVGQPQMYIDTLMITRILFEWCLPEDLALLIIVRIVMQDTRAPDERGEVDAEASALLASRVPLPVELCQASARLEMPIWQVI